VAAAAAVGTAGLTDPRGMDSGSVAGSRAAVGQLTR
jgi:hypothetical protein